MLLGNEIIPMTWHPMNRKPYEEKGYVFTGFKTIFYPKVVDVVDCSSGAKIPVQCDYCGMIYYPTVRNYEKVHNRGEKDCCVSCKGKKIKKTVQERYGVNNVVYLETVREQMKETCMKRYGTESPLENDSIYQKTKESVYVHYGVDNCSKVPEVVRKREATMREKYGYNYPLQNEEILKRSRETLYKNGSCPTSKKQIDLSKMLKEMYGNCELNYPCDKISLDCMLTIKGIKFDVEYDGWYWHKDKQNEDKRRDYFVESKGYKVLRIIAKKDILPTKEQIEKEIKFLLTTNKKFSKIVLE